MVSDYKYMTGNGSNLASHIEVGAKQAKYVIVKLSNTDHAISKWFEEGQIKAKLDRIENLKGVIILNHDGSLLVEKYR